MALRHVYRANIGANNARYLKNVNCIFNFQQTFTAFAEFNEPICNFTLLNLFVFLII